MASPLNPLSRPTAPTDPARAQNLFIVRESDEWDMELFNTMRQQTYFPHRDIPEIDAVLRAGLAPFHGDSFTVEFRAPGAKPRQETVIVEHLTRGACKAILFHYRGQWHLWSQASAVKANKGEINGFTGILIDTVLRLRPVNVYAAYFSRLIRSHEQGMRLQAELIGNVDTVWAGELAFAFTGINRDIGQMMFSMFAWIASMERDWIVRRLLAGRIAKWRRHEWPFGHGTIPFGYMLDSATRQLVPDPGQREAVREMLLILCNEQLPTSEAMRQLSRAGVTSMRKHRRLGVRTPAAAIQASDSFINGLYAWAPLWVHGEYLWRMTNVFPDHDEISGVPIVRAPGDATDVGELQMLYRVPVPEGGWAEPEILTAFGEAAVARTRALLGKGSTAERPLSEAVSEESKAPRLLAQLLSADNARNLDAAAARRRERARSKRSIAPLAGRSWLDDDWHYELQVSSRSAYRLVRWPLANGSRTGEPS
ncbi:hypothetical protein GCM10028801_45560 [Nocardioides maradonensis]